MHTYRKGLLFFVLCLLITEGCKKDNSNNGITRVSGHTDVEILSETLNLPDSMYNYAKIGLPFYFNAVPVSPTDNTPAANPVTNEGATLGRVLFYDKSLSVNNTIACASCHHQSNSFSDVVQFSKGYEGGFTTRNSMSLANARFYNNGTFFWDERAATLEAQTLMPIEHPVEMGMTLDALEEKLATKDYYKVLFRQAFGDSVVNRDRISKALAQFIRAMVSYQSRYDEGLVSLGHPPGPNENMPGFSQQENQGLRLYQQNCGRCHGTEVQVINTASNNGLDQVYIDNGVGAITGRPQDNGKFKVPSLRNAALTAPYMHDGRFKTLDEVVEHYNSGVKNHPNLDPRLRTPGTNQPQQLALNSQQKAAIVAFINTLTDTKFTSDVRYSDPFK